ncbi:flagellar basal body-associated FliL family protein [Octadecabacter sp.]|nr:flagellar basal body-associated FliL family protein [Octadecabacter sp.]
MAVSDETPALTGDDVKKRRSKMPLILGLVLGLLGAGGGFMAVQSGFIDGSHEEAHDEHRADAEALPNLSFLPMDTLVINLPQNAQAKHLLFTAQLEVGPEYIGEVTEMMPRVTDILNGYLRSVDLAELESPTALIRLRAQMLRRIQVVVGEGRVNDLLIMEFVLN